MSVDHKHPIAARFRTYLPVVVDVETGGFDSRRDALLEMAAVTLNVTDQGLWQPGDTHSCHVEPFPGAHLDPAALEFNGIGSTIVHRNYILFTIGVDKPLLIGLGLLPQRFNHIWCQLTITNCISLLCHF